VERASVSVLAGLTYSAMHEQESTIQLSAAAKCRFLDILMQQIAESRFLAHASLSNLTRQLVQDWLRYTHRH